MNMTQLQRAPVVVPGIAAPVHCLFCERDMADEGGVEARASHPAAGQFEGGAHACGWALGAWDTQQCALGMLELGCSTSPWDSPGPWGTGGGINSKVQCVGCLVAFTDPATASRVLGLEPISVQWYWLVTSLPPCLPPQSHRTWCPQYDGSCLQESSQPCTA